MPTRRIMQTRCVCRWAGYDVQHVARVRGIKRLSDRKKDSGEKGKSTRSPKKKSASSADQSDGARRSGGAKWGRVLRTAYDDALREPVPAEFLDLLGKLD